MNRRIALTLGAALAVPGCASVNIGKDFDLESFEERVTVGETQRTDVRRWLGEPVSTGQVVNSDGTRREEWTYYHGTGRLPRMENTQIKYLEIRFRADGTVDSYKWSGETE